MTTHPITDLRDRYAGPDLKNRATSHDLGLEPQAKEMHHRDQTEEKVLDQPLSRGAASEAFRASSNSGEPSGTTTTCR